MAPSAALCLAVALLASTALAFNLGHHNDLIRSVLRSYTYTDDAADVVVLGSWYTDYFAYYDPLDHMKSLDYLHYDALNTQDEIREYTERVRAHLLAAIDAADAPYKRLLALGAALHAAADLMSHSNWGEGAGMYRPSCEYYRSDTPTRASAPLSFFTFGCDEPCQTPELANRSTHAAHGGQCSGPHRDNYARPGWEEAYVFAFFWLHDWVATVHSLRPQVVADASSYSASWLAHGPLKNDLNATWNFGTYYKTSTLNGIYKAPGSGRATPFTPVAASSYATVNQFRTAMGNMQDRIGGKSLYSPFTAPASPSMGLVSHEVDVRVVYIRILFVGYFHTEPFHPYDLQVDPYVKVTVDGQVFLTEPLIDERNNAGVKPNWKIMAFVPRSKSTVGITIEMYDQNYAFNDNQYMIDLYCAPKITLSLNMDTKNVTNLRDPNDQERLGGVRNTADHCFWSTTGADEGADMAEIHFYVDVRETGSMAGTMAANCPDELAPVLMCSAAN